MNRRQLLGAVPALGIASTAFAQPPGGPPPGGRGPGGAPGAGRGGPPPPPVEPALPMTVLATGLAFPEAPIWLKDGSLLFVEIGKGRISRLTPDNKVETWLDIGDAPNGLGIGPDGALYVANDGNRFGYMAQPDGTTPLGGPTPAPFRPGRIQRIDMKTKAVTPLYTHVEGKEIIAVDDLVFDKHGGMWISEYGRAAGTGAIYYALPNGKSIKVARGGLNSPNGIGVSPDGKMLHVSMGSNLYGYDITGPGQLATTTYPNQGIQGPLQGIADSLKVMADGRVAVCELTRPGGIGIHKGAESQFLAFPDRFTCNLAFGGADWQDCWIMLSGSGKIAKVRWPSPGLKPAYTK